MRRHKFHLHAQKGRIAPDACKPCMTVVDQLAALPTPALLLDERRMLANIARLRERAAGLGVRLRPHLKTAKSVDVARRLLEGGAGAATVSTLREAEVFFRAGVRDLLYAVGIAPQKLPQVAALRAAGCDLTVLLDTPEQADALVAASRAAGAPFPALIEIDCDGQRGGLAPDDDALIRIGRRLQEGAELRGVMTHAGAGATALSASRRMRPSPSANATRWCRLQRGCGRLVCHARWSASVRRRRHSPPETWTG